LKKYVVVTLASLVVGFALMQLVPYRVSNPPVQQEPPWDSPRTRALAVSACFDCHSNETKHQWYMNVAPASWWITHHVREGRSALNFSEWQGPSSDQAREAAEAVAEGSMPPPSYTWFGRHPSAALTKQERDELAQGLRKSLGN
jgi:heme-binding protein